MNKKFLSIVVMTSLTIFAMLFGAGNLMFPLRVGMESGSNVLAGLAGFIVTGVILPLLGLLAIVSFNGNYRVFFDRLGTPFGFIATLFCMMIIGPLVVMPRIVMLSYEMLQPFLPAMSPLIFAVFFLSLTFFATYKPSRLLDIIGKFLSPLKVTSILLIIVIGMVKGVTITPSAFSVKKLFIDGLHYGYYTLDLIGSIFFGSMIVSLLTRYAHADEKTSTRNAIKIAGISSICAAFLLAGVYVGMGYLGAFHGHGLEALNEGQIFSAISLRILGTYGAALIGLTVFLACFTTTVSLTAVVADYVQHSLLRGNINYMHSVGLVLVTTAAIARMGLTAILDFSVPFIVAAYPIFIVITLCNILYKLFGFKYIKLPVAITLLYVIYVSLL
ncbi:MAG: branched-chain amino acid transport system II carrier protein [Candidatus Babeliaceae bacterium]|jgi:LIVCS family branched-chain amino acid:cation transporter